MHCDERHRDRGPGAGPVIAAADLERRLEELHVRTGETPLFNPVFQLGLELSRKLESGETELDTIESLVTELECVGLRAKAARLIRLAGPIDPATNDARLRSLSDEDDYAAFAAHWQRPLAHIVFTAHPTFLLSAAQTKSVAAAASTGDTSQEAVCAVPGGRDPITLDTEHEAAMAAMIRAQDARDRINAALFEIASTRWPKRWRSLQPLPVRLASWVGYDMDGRTDISWSTSIRYRLMEKAQRLARYAVNLEPLEPDLAARLRRAGAHSDAMAAHFAADLSAPADLSAAADALTAPHPDALVSLAPIIAKLEAESKDADPHTARGLLVVAAAMRADGLGMGWVHFRVNSSQLQNAIRYRIDPDGKLGLGSQAALMRMRELLAEVKPLRSNFAALGIENSTAVRQFLAMAQILGHIDADAPIRMLVAECEQPATVLAALYFAKMFGIDDKVDVSPLFETETALEHGGRFLDALLAEDAYREYARLRGRVAIQTGYSDAGRFVGQIPAALAIERLQGRLAEAMVANGLSDVAALIFNTHGESMGRGAHPASWGGPAAMADVGMGAAAVRARGHPAGARGQLPGRRRLPVLRLARTRAGDAHPVRRSARVAGGCGRSDRPVLPPHRPQPRLLSRGAGRATRASCKLDVCARGDGVRAWTAQRYRQSQVAAPVGYLKRTGDEPAADPRDPA